MNLELAFDKCEDEYIKFDKIIDPPSNRPDLCAFLKLDELCPSDSKEDMISVAEHDEIWLATDCEALAKVATYDDVVYLARCGVRFDEGLECLAMFV